MDKWKMQWNCLIAPTRVPGVWKRKGGGHLVRARIVDPSTGRKREIRKVLPEADLATAYQWLTDQRDLVRAGRVVAQLPKTRFADFALSVLEFKVEQGHLKSAKSVERWKHTLEHLIGGTVTADEARHVPGLGDYFVDQIRPEHVEDWRAGIVGLIRAGEYSPNTANGWLSILRVIAQEAKRRFKLPEVFTDGVPDFDTSEHVTYPEEAPNSLTSEQVPRFLAVLRELYPAHYAMTYLGLATGLRPSSMRPLRRSGLTPDVLWEQRRLLVRRSQTIGEVPMNTTKQRTRYAIDLPEEVMAVLKWHANTQLVTPQQAESELLFPAVTGGYRAPTVLNKPFAEVSDAIGLGYHFTQSGMRRTFNDLARAAKVEAIVTRSISGHLTERMQHHYSTVRPDEQRESIGRVVDLMTARRSQKSASGTPSEPASSGESGTHRVASGTHGGTQPPASGTQNEKAG